MVSVTYANSRSLLHHSKRCCAAIVVLTHFDLSNEREMKIVNYIKIPSLENNRKRNIQKKRNGNTFTFLLGCVKCHVFNSYELKNRIFCLRLIQFDQFVFDFQTLQKYTNENRFAPTDGDWRNERATKNRKCVCIIIIYLPIWKSCYYYYSICQ